MRLKTKFSFSIIALLLLISSYGCSSLGFGKFDEGEIEYEVSYPKVNPDDFMSAFLPKDLTLHFKGEMQKLEMVAGMGVFRSSYIINSSKESVQQSLKLMNKKMTTSINENAQNHFTRPYGKVEIELVNETKEIAGYQCKKAIATFPDSDRPQVILYYTEDIKIKKGNWFLPYAEVPGTLLSFEMELYSMLLKIEAVNVKLEPIDDNVFTVPGEYKMITNSEMDTEFQGVFDAFKE